MAEDVAHCVTHDPHRERVESILVAYAEALGPDFSGYRNHVLRVLGCYAALGGEPSEQLVIAAAFHDLGIWAAATFDYLAPSVALALEHLASSGLADHAAEVEAVIVNHHKLRRYRGPFERTVELFRRADLIDVSLGLIRFGVVRQEVRAVRASLGNAGFHRRLLELTMREFVRHPLRPLPMIRW